MKHPKHHTYTLTLHVRNQPGVLVRCAQVFNRRGHNIEALKVAASEKDEDLSTMTITAFGNKEAMAQVVAQLAKLVDVQHIQEQAL